MAAKKVSKSGASDRAKKAQASRLRAQARAADQPLRGKRAASERMSEQAFRTQNKLWPAEGGGVYSTALYNKGKLNFARQQALGAKTASQQMKQGVTKSGGYAGAGVQMANLNEMRRVKSAKFKAEQANKKKGAR